MKNKYPLSENSENGSGFKTILITGATGFVGSALLARVVEDMTCIILGTVRYADTVLPAGAVKVAIKSLDDARLASSLNGVDVVIHCAARVHVMDETANDPLAEFRKTNVEGTARLAQMAAAVGVKRFIFVSSIKVNGEETWDARPFSAEDNPDPQDAYGISKMEAEIALRQIGSETGMQITIVRPPLVYGPGVKANFLSIMRLLKTGIPLPLGNIRNRRSMVALDNLVDVLCVCIDHPAAANQTFLVSDGEDLSTTELLRRLSIAMNRPVRLISIPAGLLAIGAIMLGKRSIGQRLLGSLQVDIEKTRSLLGWTPPVSVDDAIYNTVTNFLRNSTK